MPNPAVYGRIKRAVIAATDFLERLQDEDGCWRDYQLEPGRSKAWTTACAGCASGGMAGLPAISGSGLDRAAAALLADWRAEGWGYNPLTSCDADTTSWVIRFLASRGALGEVPAVSLLQRYMTPRGGVHTFASPERFGCWAAEHDEVAAMAGRALLAADEYQGAARIRNALLERWKMTGWQPFWWQSGAYVQAKCLTFLCESGGIPQEVESSERQKLTEPSSSQSPFEVSQLLETAICLTEDRKISRFGECLLDMQCGDGSWVPSAALLVPNQNFPTKFSVHLDDRRVLTTSMCLLSLKGWTVLLEPAIRKTRSDTLTPRRRSRR